MTHVAQSMSAVAVPPELRERLGALGYLGTGPPVSPKPDSAKKGRAEAEDPKDKLADYKALSTAMQQIGQAMYAKQQADAGTRGPDVEGMSENGASEPGTEKADEGTVEGEFREV